VTRRGFLALLQINPVYDPVYDAWNSFATTMNLWAEKMRKNVYDTELIRRGVNQWERFLKVVPKK